MSAAASPSGRTDVENHQGLTALSITIRNSARELTHISTGITPDTDKGKG